MAARHSIIAPFPSDIDRDRFGDWLSGFTDGEGCFLLHWQRIRHVGTARFLLTLRHDDRPILETIQSFWKCGILGYEKPNVPHSPNTKPRSFVHVNHLSHLMQIVIPHFERYPLRAKKARDFVIWRQGVEFLYRIKGRRKRTRGWHGGTFPAWTETERHDFQSILASLREQRRYESPPIEVPPSTDPQGRWW